MNENKKELVNELNATENKVEELMEAYNEQGTSGKHSYTVYGVYGDYSDSCC